ncbi:hypothetical protein IT570_09630 [Candidatus Sumerlaeota bacterium]|nr:hypothetical protein [Candidatus Sumerlaeota bacterium]
MRSKNSYETPTPKVFSAGQRKYNPLLAAEDTNHVFEAFLRRRKLHRVRIADRIPPAGRSNHDGRGKDVFLFILIGAALSTVTCFIAYPMIIICGMTINIRARISYNRLPSRLTNVFSFKGYADAPALDLVQAGLKGSTLVEALFLEGCHLHHSVLKYVYGAVAAGVVLFLAYASWPFPPVGWLLLIAAGMTAWRGWYIITERKAITVARQMILPRLLHWASSTPLQGVLTYMRIAAPRILVSLLFYVVVNLGVIILLIVSMELIGSFTNAHNVRNYETFFIILGSVALFAVCALSFVGAGKRAEKARARMDFCLSVADDAFENFVLTRILDDPDARRLAGELNLGPKVIDQVRNQEWKFLWKRM